MFSATVPKVRVVLPVKICCCYSWTDKVFGLVHSLCQTVR
jgi:hypothetical protein